MLPGKPPSCLPPSRSGGRSNGLISASIQMIDSSAPATPALPPATPVRLVISSGPDSVRDTAESVPAFRARSHTHRLRRIPFLGMSFCDTTSLLSSLPGYLLAHRTSTPLATLFPRPDFCLKASRLIRHPERKTSIRSSVARASSRSPTRALHHRQVHPRLHCVGSCSTTPRHNWIASDALCCRASMQCQVPCRQRIKAIYAPTHADTRVAASSFCPSICSRNPSCACSS